MRTEAPVIVLALLLSSCVGQSNKRSTSNAANDKTFDAVKVLEKFGYLDDQKTDDSHSENSIKEGIREYQKFNGLPVTGVLDGPTVKQMKKPRCGLPDVVKPSKRTAAQRNQPFLFYAPGYKWQKKDLVYKIVEYTRRLGGQSQQEAFRMAFQSWADVVPLTFRETQSGPADIDIKFARGSHGDGNGNAFDGRGQTLAHAFFPGDQPLSGDAHFDDDELWTMGAEEGRTNLQTVAAHEFGHVLGLAHSNVPRALMAPYYQGPTYQLHADDVQGIQTLYGARTKPPVTSRPPVTTARPRPPKPPVGKYCNLTFDDIAANSDGYYYAFRQTRVYKIGPEGVESESSIQSVFPNSPSSPGAAVFDRSQKRLYIFKGNHYWRYTAFRLDAGYPKTLPADFANVQAAMQWSDGGIYLFKGDNYMRWAEGLTRVSSGYPRPVASYWRDAPTSLEAALQGNDGSYYFFKGTRYWKYDSHARLQSGYPRDARGAWLSCGTRTPR